MMAYSGHIMTLANSIIGVGILAMPYCFQKCGIILSVLLLIVSNWITRICCHYLIKSSLLTRRKSFEFLGFHAFGASGKLLAELCIIGYLFGTAITYFVVMGDLGPQIASKMLSLKIDDFPHLRTWVMIGVTFFCILPLAMLKNVDSLSTVCAASIGFYVCLVLKIVLESEQHIVAHDWMDKVEYWRPAGILQCLPIFSMALSCQMQLFEVFESINNQSIEKLNGIVRNATWICTFVYISVGFFGYVAFCTEKFAGNILLNLTPSFGSDVIKIGFVLSVAFSFPLVVFPCRASLYSLLYRKGHTDNTGYIPETRFKVITTCLVGGALCIALIIPSVELIIGLVGSTIGVAICIMFPALCFRKIIKKDSAERALAQFVYVGGFCLMILGTVANLNAIDERHSGAHLHVAEGHAGLLMPTQVTSAAIKMDAAVLLQSKIVKVDPKAGALELRDSIEKKNPESVMNATPELKMPHLTDMENKENEKWKLKLKQSKIVEHELNNLKVSSPNPNEDVKQKVENVPIDVESHKNQQIEDVESHKNQQIEEPAPKDAANPPTNPATLQKQISQSEQGIHKQHVQMQQQQQQQPIDDDAIKKDEQIAAEESKNMRKSANSAKDKDDELKKTQKELKQTKELLERTVDQLKQELTKQNEQTKNMVAEKLEKVVQKVEQIEKKVIQNAPPEQPPTPQAQLPGGNKANEENAVHRDELKSNDVVKKSVEERPPLLNMLSEPPAVNAAVGVEHESELKKVYEPLSYKTGQLIEEAKNGSNHAVEQTLPQPLAVLFNASNIKNSNNNNNSETNMHVRVVAADKLLANLTQQKTENVSQVAAAAANDNNNNNNNNNDEKENVEAIRREILNLNQEKLKEFPSAALSATNHIDENNDYNNNKNENDASNGSLSNAQHLRQRRSSPAAQDSMKTIDFESIESKLQKNNCLPEPSVAQLSAHGGLSGNGIDLKMQNIGRELRSVSGEQEEIGK